MIRRDLNIGRWHVEFYFCPDGYDEDELLARMYDFGAGIDNLRAAEKLMGYDTDNTGFAFTNGMDFVAMIVIGPYSSRAEFLDTLTHEIHHLAVAIASELGVDLEGEEPAYIAGDSARDLADVICALGCKCG